MYWQSLWKSIATRGTLAIASANRTGTITRYRSTTSRAVWYSTLPQPWPASTRIWCTCSTSRSAPVLTWHG